MFFQNTVNTEMEVESEQPPVEEEEVEEKKDYSSFPPLHGTPRVGDIIAFKVRIGARDLLPISK